MSDQNITIERDIDFSGYEGEDTLGISIQGEELEDLSIAGTPLNIYELLILICQKGQKKVDERGAMTLFHKKGPHGTGSPGAAKYGTELKNNSIRLKVHAATAEITRQLLSTVTNRRVIYVPQHGALVHHGKPKPPTEIGTHAAGMAWDHGDYRKVGPPAAPTFFYTDNNSALTTRQLIAAVAALCDQGILPEGRLGFYGTKHVINNMHYDYLLWSRKTENKNLFTKINNKTQTGGNASGWYWHDKKAIPTGWGTNSKIENLLWIKKRRSKNKSIDEILYLYEQYSVALQDIEITTLQQYLDYLAERDASASPWVKMKKMT